MHTPEAAIYLESHCGKALWSMFVTVIEADRDLITRECPGRPNVVYRPNASEPIHHPGPAVSELAHFGITHTLDEVFDAPLAVKNVLNDNSRLADCYVGTEKVRQSY